MAQELDLTDKHDKPDPMQISLDDADSKTVPDPTTKITIYLKDGTVIAPTLTRKACEQSLFLKGMLEDPECKEFHMQYPLYHAASMTAVARWLEYHENVAMVEIEKPLKNTDMVALVGEWDGKFCMDLPVEVLFETVLVANYLQIEPLRMLLCARIASLIKGKTPAEIRKFFNITQEFTPEEEARIRAKYAKLLEKDDK